MQAFGRKPAGPDAADWKSTGSRSARMRSPARLLPHALLALAAALALLLSGGGVDTANAQETSLVLVSNFGVTETPTHNELASVDLSQRFTTGVGSGEFTLSSIEVRLNVSTNTETPTMKLLSGSADGTVVATLSGPSALDPHSTKEYSFTPASPVTLTARTQYWVTLEGSSGQVVGAETGRAEETSQPGWALDNYSYSRKHYSTGAFNDQLFPVLIRIKGNLVDLPAADATGLPTITVPNVYRVPALLAVDMGDVFDVNGIANIDDSITYNWQRFDAGGTTLETDNIGTGATYTLTDADAGKTIKVVVSFTDDSGAMEGPLTSAATPLIVAAATDCTAPTYVGGAVQIWTGKMGVRVASYPGDSGTTNRAGFGRLAVFPDSGTLDDTSFTADHEYELVGVWHESGVGVLIPVPYTALNIMLAHTSASLTDAEYYQLVLHVCNREFLFQSTSLFGLGEESSGELAGKTFTQVVWDAPGLDWSTHAERTLYISRDQVAPTLSWAVVDGTEVVLTFSEDLGDAVSLANTAFQVKRTPPGGSEQTLTLSSTPPVISGNTVTLTLDPASSVAPADTKVRVSYTKPTTGTDNALVDRFSNQVADFTHGVNVCIGTSASSEPSLEDITGTGRLAAQPAASWRRGRPSPGA